MAKHKSHGKDKKKNSQLVIRVERAERDAFVALCDRLDTSAAREIRRFMREQVAAEAATETTDMPTAGEMLDGATASVEAAAPAITAEADVVADDAVAAEARKPAKKRKRAVL